MQQIMNRPKTPEPAPRPALLLREPKTFIATCEAIATQIRLAELSTPTFATAEMDKMIKRLLREALDRIDNASVLASFYTSR
jgi:hypothetical protein